MTRVVPWRNGSVLDCFMWTRNGRDKGDVTDGEEGLCARVGKFAYTQKTKESQREGCPKHDSIKFLGKVRTQKC